MKRKYLAILLVLSLALTLMSAAAFADGAVLTISETAAVDSFLLPEGVTLAAPEGKLLTVTVDGVETNIEPGVTYTGDIVLTVTDRLDIHGHEGSMADWAGSDYRAAIYLNANGLQEAGSVLAAAPDYSYEDGVLTVGDIRSEGTTFNGLIVSGGRHTIQDADIVLKGDGGNDFNGYGAAILLTGDDTEVLLDNIHVDATGLTRGAMSTAGSAKALIMNSVYAAHEGVLPEDYVQNVENVSGIMKAAPWTLGISGTNRATNLLGNAASTYFNCDVSADGWGILSADDATAPKLTVVNTKVHSDGAKVYGAFGIGDGSEIRLLGAEFDVTGMLVNMAGGTLLVGPATEENLQGVYGAEEILASGQLDSQRNTVLRTTGDGIRAGGVVTIQPGTVIEAGGPAILSKGSKAELYFDGAEITSGSGVILQIMDSDDAGANFMAPGAPLNTSYTENDAEPVYIEGRDLGKINRDYEGQTMTFEDMIAGKSLTVNGSSGLAIEASFANMEIAGDFYNASESFAPADKVGVASSANNLFLTFDNTAVEGVISAALAEHVDPATGAVLKTIDSWQQVGQVKNTVRPVINNGVNVELKNGSVWTVTGTAYISGLVIDETSAVNGVMTVDGAAVEPVPGIYAGVITLEPAPGAAPSGEASAE